MSIRIGWSRSSSRRPRQVAGGIWLFELLKVRDGRGRHFVVGFLSYNREDLQRFTDQGQTLDTRVIGLLRFERNVTPALFNSVFNQIDVTGRIIAPPQLEEALATKA